MATKQVDMEFVKATKHTLVYEAIEEAGKPNPVCRSVYLTKTALPTTPPPAITLTVEWKE